MCRGARNPKSGAQMRDRVAMQVLLRSARPRDGGRRTGWLSHPGRIDERCVRCFAGALSALVRFIWNKGDEVSGLRLTKGPGSSIAYAGAL